MSQKVFNKICIIDGSYMLHRNLKIPEIFELKNKKGQRTGGVFGFLRSLNSALKSADYYPVICWDSGLSDRRLRVYPDYKSNLSKSHDYHLNDVAKYLVDHPGDQPPEKLSDTDLDTVKEKITYLIENRRKFGTTQDESDYMYQYRTQRGMIIDICNSLGIPSLKFSGWEGDDIITVISRMSMRSVIITDDRDMIQLLSPSTDVNRVVNNQYLTYNEYLSSNNMTSIREMVIIKAIEGDGSDNIPSVTSELEERKYRVGGTTAAKIAKVIIENNEDPNKYLPVCKDYPGRDHNKFLGFTKCHDKYLRNMELVDLSLVDNDYDIVDNIVAEVKSHIGKSNFMSSLSKLGELDIVNVDVNSIIGKVTLSFHNALL